MTLKEAFKAHNFVFFISESWILDKQSIDIT